MTRVILYDKYYKIYLSLLSIEFAMLYNIYDIRVLLKSTRLQYLLNWQI